MKNVLMSFAIAVLCIANVNAQCCDKSTWYVGTGDIANTAWTEWSIAPTVGYALNDKLMVGVNVSQVMETVFNYLNGFFSGLAGVLLTVLPLTILWEVLTGGLLFNMDVITNLTSLVNEFGTGGFAGLVVLVLVASFFVKK
jgi:hypothetical protein